MPLAPNSRLGRYEIRSLLGEGGMGEVYLAQDTTLRRFVAIKLLPADFTAKRDRLHRFEREAHAASSLNHPNILTIHEIGIEDGHHFIATEFIDGESLRQHINRTQLELHEVLEIGIQVASALAAAHAAGIVHRDIKPENVMVRSDGIIKVLDFGLAKLVEQEQKPAPDTEAPTRELHHTGPGVVMGTASYMSPEQARGVQVDARTDIWSLGVMLYEMVAGRLPFAGETTTDVLGLILHKEPPPLTDEGAHVPAELDRIVTKALRKDKEERYQGVKDLGLDLKSLKQRLEFQAELERGSHRGLSAMGTLERVESPEGISQARQAATSDGGNTAGTSKIEATPTEQTGGAGYDTHTTSSAEYIVTEIKRHKRGAALVLATLLLAIMGVAYFYFARSGKGAIGSVAVLPFVNASNDPNMEYLSDGISESLINNLSQLPQLKVIARSSTFKYKSKEIDPEEVAKTLGVGAIVTGRIVVRGDDLQISVELMNASDKTEMWGEQYNRRAADLQTVQAEIAHTVSEKLRLRLTGGQEQQLVKHPTQNPEAYQLYLNGLFYYRKSSNDDVRKAVDFFAQAVTLDPHFALAWVGLANGYRSLVARGIFNPEEGLPKQKAAIAKALEADQMSAEAHATLADIDRLAWDLAGAERESHRALELNPNLADAHAGYAYLLSYLRQNTAALVEIKRAQELDPLSTRVRVDEAFLLQRDHRYDESSKVFQDVLGMQPDNSSALYGLGFNYTAKGMYAEAITEYQKYIASNPEDTATPCYLGYALAQSGRRPEALAILEKLKRTKDYVSPASLATLYAGLGDKESALAELQKGFDTHDPNLLDIDWDPTYDSLRSDPRFQEIARRVGLTP